MIPRVGGKGNSFQGAGMYYLHDKREEGQKLSLSDERVEWTDTHNLPTKDAWQALYHMADTAQNHDKLKELAGISVRRSASGDPKSVYTYSLGWKTGDEQVDNEMMRKACVSSLQAIGLGKHQALFVRHGDTDHQHIHVIANLIDPENGKVNSMGNDHTKLSGWAEKWVNENGGTVIEQRVENNRRRDNGEFVKYDPSHTREEWLSEKQRKSSFWDGIREDRKSFDQQHLDQKAALFGAKEEQILGARKLIKDAFKPRWSELFSDQRGQTKSMEDKKDTLLGRITHVLKNRVDVLGERAGLGGYYNAVINQQGLKDTLEKTQKTERSKLIHEQGDTTRDQMKLINKGYKVDRLALLDQQQEQQTTFKSQTDDKVNDFREATYDTWNDLANDDGMERERERMIPPPENKPD